MTDSERFYREWSDEVGTYPTLDDYTAALAAVCGSTSPAPVVRPRFVRAVEYDNSERYAQAASERLYQEFKMRQQGSTRAMYVGSTNVGSFWSS